MESKIKYVIQSSLKLSSAKTWLPYKDVEEFVDIIEAQKEKKNFYTNNSICKYRIMKRITTITEEEVK